VFRGLSVQVCGRVVERGFKPDKDAPRSVPLGWKIEVFAVPAFDG